LQYAPEGLWQIIRIFTGFYNIPVIAIVLVGLFTKRVPALGPKLVVGFHIVAYGLFQFVLDDVLQIHFLHLYAILFFIEVVMMLTIGHFWPRTDSWIIHQHKMVDMTPWRFAVPCATSLLSCVIALYLLFSAIGLVGGLSVAFYPMLAGLALLNIGVWAWYTAGRSLGLPTPTGVQL